MEQLSKQNLFRKIANRVIVYFALLKINFLNKRGTYGELIFAGLTTFLRICIFASVYRIAFGQDNQGYIAAIWAICVSQIIFTHDRPEPTTLIGEEIKEGIIDISLLRPLNYIQYIVVGHIGRSLPALIVNSIACISAGLILTRAIPIWGLHLVYSFIAIFLGSLVVTFIAAVLGTLGFWTHDTQPFSWISQKFALLFGGLIIPLSVLPDTVQNIVSFIPWGVGIARPGRLIGDFSYSELFETISLQVFYIIVLYFLAVFLYNKGIKKLNSSGG